MPSCCFSLLDAIAWPAEKGARNYIHAALDDTTPGAFISCCKQREPANLVTSPEGQRLQKKFWGEISKLYESIMSS